MKKDSKIFIIDDEQEVCDSISLLLNSAGYDSEAFPAIEDFLNRDSYNGAGCILLDVFLKGKSGIELQEEIEEKYDRLPIIFMTGYGSIPMSVEALKKGAINFLEKPIDESSLFKAIEEALERSFVKVTEYDEIERIKPLINSLTAREYEIFRYVIAGNLNKQIAAELGIAEHTVKNHRLRISAKLQVKSVADMIYMAEKLSIKGANITI